MFKNKHLFLTVLESVSLRSRSWHGYNFGGNPSPTLHMVVFLIIPHMVKRDCSGLPFSYRGSNMIMGDPPCNLSTPSYLTKTSPSNTIILTIRASTCEF